MVYTPSDRTLNGGPLVVSLRWRFTVFIFMISTSGSMLRTRNSPT